MLGGSSDSYTHLAGIHIPVVHTTLQRLFNLVHGAEPSRDQVIECIETDPGLLGLFLSLSGTLEIELSNWATDLDLEFVKLVVMARSLQSKATTAHLFAIWRGSRQLAAIGFALAEAMGREDGHVISLLCELSAIGQYVVMASSEEPYVGLPEKNSARSQEDPDPRREELQTFGGNRFELAAKALEQWNLVNTHIEAIRYHAAPWQNLVDADETIRVLAAADILTGDTSERSLDACSHLLGMPADEIAGLVARLEDDSSNVLESVSALTSPSENDGFHDSLMAQTVMSLFRYHLMSMQDETLWWSRIRQSVSFLFGMNHPVLWRIEGNALVTDDVKVADVYLSVQPAHSAISECMKQSRARLIKDSDKLMVVDRQIVSRLRAEWLVCLPLMVDGSGIGVLTLSAHQEPKDDLLKQLMSFAEIVAEQCQTRETSDIESDVVFDSSYFDSRAREITHEVNNPLSIVQNYLKVLSLKLDEEHAAQDDLKTIADEMVRIGGIVEKFSAIGSAEDRASMRANINDVVSEMVSVVQGSSPDVKFTVNLDDHLKEADISRGSLKQIVLNLLKNSVEAIDGEGKVLIATRRGVNQSGHLFTELTVADDGRGISEEVRSQLFKPTKSSKGEEHQGLGLSIVKKLVDDLNGVISCRSKAGEGCEFQILIPERELEKCQI